MTDRDFLAVARGAYEAGIEVNRRGPDMMIATRGIDQIWVKLPGITYIQRFARCRQLADDIAGIIKAEVPGTSVLTSTRRVVTKAAPGLATA